MSLTVLRVRYPALIHWRGLYHFSGRSVGLTGVLMKKTGRYTGVASETACLKLNIGFDLRIRRTHRNTLGVYVYPSGRVEVRVPKYAEAADIAAFIKSQKRWIEQKLDAVSTPVRDNSALHYLHGEKLDMALMPGKTSVELEDAQLRVSIPDIHNRDVIQRCMIEWYRKQALSHFSQRLEFCLQRFSHPRPDMPSLKVRRMRTRWGSCSSRGSVNLNLWLIRLPQSEQDYVITHELCHLIELNHGPHFYALMSDVMPDWQSRKKSLDSHPAASLQGWEY